MDRTDRKILALYQSDTRRIAESIGAEVGLSAAAVQRRLKRLRMEGAIRNEIAVLDARAAGVPVLCVVLLTMASRPKPAAHSTASARRCGARRKSSNATRSRARAISCSS